MRCVIFGRLKTAKLGTEKAVRLHNSQEVIFWALSGLPLFKGVFFQTGPMRLIGVTGVKGNSTRRTVH
jgi:hypothetical protein